MVAGRQSDFEAVFGSGGIWRELLNRKLGYMGTEVACESQNELRFRVWDFWASHYAFEVFRRKFAVEYERFDRLILSEGFVHRQEFIGAYYESSEDGDDLVPS